MGLVIRGSKSLAEILGGLPELPGEPEIVAPTTGQRARWTKTTRLYVEHLENFIHEMTIEVRQIEATMRVLKFGAAGEGEQG